MDKKLTEADVREKLGPLLSSNQIDVVEELSEGEFQLKHPWGDRTIALAVDHSNIETISDALNGVKLPERLSAVYHAEAKQLEIIWTAMRLSQAQEEVIGRKFSFKYKQDKHLCSFSSSSRELLILAEHCVQIEPTSDTSFRNLNSYQWYLTAKDVDINTDDFPKFLSEPRSMFISNVPDDADHMIYLCISLNFYMSYYDSRTPTILIHSPEENHAPYTRDRFPLNKFPSSIEATDLDENLLWYWNNKRSNDIQTRYLDCFKILEYCSFHYLKNNSKSQIRRILADPALQSRIDEAIEEVVGVITVENSRYENRKFESFFESCFSCELVWKEVDNNRELFSKAYRFDGGYEIKPLIQESDQIGQFKKNGLERLARTFRDLRNVLSHGRDAGAAGVVRPTRRNLNLLRPWTRLIEVCAAEAILYRNLN